MEEVFPALTAGVISTIVCNPLDVIRINYQLNNKKNLYNKDILYRGLGYSLLTIPSFWVIYFPTYKKTKEIFSTPVAAYLSSCIGSIFTTPLWILRQKSMTLKKHCFKTSNLQDYYRGLNMTFLVNLNFIIQLPVYEYLKKKVDNTTVNIFLVSSISKILSTCVFYPLDTIRVKLRNNENLGGMKLHMYYRGIGVYLIRNIPYYSVVFCTYEFVKKIM
tara:strand:+ start:2646 stop:3299 length:654 start_codon:yes stop_codon:yes gene_type:complete